MNYLAHLFLSEGTIESRIGNLMGDFIKSEGPAMYPRPFRRGIALHWKIDQYTDAHRLFQVSQRRVSVEQRRFSGVLVDVFYDHFLAAHWSQYSAQPLGDFVQQVYAALSSYAPILPDALRAILPNMIAEDWLTSYQTLEGIGKALERIARRVKHETTLADAVDELEQHYEQFNSDFSGFFPDVMGYVQAEIAEYAKLDKS